MGSQLHSEEAKHAAGDCPLGERDQTRNLVLVGVNTGLSYLASPVLYVGVVHAALCERLGTSATVANLPATAYLVMSPLPLFVAWLFPHARQLKRILIVCYASLGLMSVLVAATLVLPVSTELQIAVLVLQGGVVGAARTVAVACEFEVLGRAVSAARRGTALGLAYGVGPILAIIGALTSQLLLTGTLGVLHMPQLAFPMNFACLFAASVPVMALGAFLSSRFVIPEEHAEAPRLPFLQGVFGGFGKFLGQPVVRRAIVVAIVILAGYTIISNLTLYTRQIVGEEPAKFAGFQNTLRFLGKALTGLILGWVLTKTHPKAGVLLTAVWALSAVAWALVAPGKWFLLSFALLGAGELFGIYITNYVLCCSPKAEMRRYMAFTMITLFPAAFAGILFGGISDHYRSRAYSEIGASVVGMGSSPSGGSPLAVASAWSAGSAASPLLAYGFRASFVVALGFIGLGLLLALLLPARPQPRT